ncbi:S8 family serine peptidase [Oscillatoria acuminata]|uniref:Subtilisin-like serine protease n=1 Tax=Oscillatoria acuminata PCC 6304 TaxID=56110 RepID=K9TSQ6_9CYAN|nr:S8 family serine peptidase [Oscillatoria acuminata]AFY85211.1 subtilisin-like serine protease [Oscillatoria acuminata PCC 6304]
MLNITHLFDEIYYLNQNPDIKEAVATGVFASGFEHFMNFGKFEGRDPSVFFDSEYYLAQNPDIAQAVAAGTTSAIEHFINMGQAERRNPIFEFFSDFYLETYPDVATSVTANLITPYQHFIQAGLFEDREPGWGFNRSFYLENNPDVATAVNAGQMSSIQHYLTAGKAEGRIASLTTQNPPSPNLTPQSPPGALSSATNLGLLESRFVNGILSLLRPKQFYRFTLDSPSDVSLVLNGAMGDADLYLAEDVNQNNKIDYGEIIASSMNDATSSESINRSLPAGTYFVEVNRYEGSPIYSLNLQATPRTDVPPDYVGNTLAEAFYLGDLTNAGIISVDEILASAGIPVPEQVGDLDPVDIYRFSLATPNQLQVTLDGLSADADVKIGIDRNQDGIISFDEVIGREIRIGTEAENIYIPALVAGEYYILVEQYSGDTTYNVTVETKPVKFPLLEAVPLVAPLSPTPQTVVGNLTPTNLADTYRFSLTAPSDIQMNLQGVGTSADLYLIQDVNGNGIVDSGEILSMAPTLEDIFNSLGEMPLLPRDSEQITFRGLPAGDYFVSVNRFARDTTYDLSLTGTPSPSNFNTLFGYGLVDAADAVARAIGEPGLAPVGDLTSEAFSNNTRDLNLMNVPAVWNRGFTGEGVIVAVLDDGVDLQHPDLTHNIWVNPNEIANNGIDDDGNGFVDDVWGWDFVDGNNDPNPDLYNAHGTHVAGTVAAQRNGVDIVTGLFPAEMNGVAYNASIMPVRVLGDYQQTRAEADMAIASGIRYAVENGAQVLQMSLGSYLDDSMFPLTEAALAFAREQGVVAVISAGNERERFGATRPSNPAFLARQNLAIAVGAVNSDNQLATFSNPAGPNPLPLVVAPGVDVLSTDLYQDYNFRTGTSMAAPHVAGVVALMLEANPTLTPAQVEQILIETAQPEGITLALA